jgi:hypothetical protein
MSGFFEELKRRKVYRVAIAYIVAGWALAQGLAQVLPLFEISSSVIRVVIVLLLIGFPVALVLAWVFDVTPQGIRATPKALPGTHRRRNIITLASRGNCHFRRRRLLFATARDGAQDRQVDCGPAISKPERRKRERLFRRWRAGRRPDESFQDW